MIAPTPESLASAATNLLTLDPPPIEAAIDEVLTRISVAFGASPEIAEEARRLLHARFAIRMDLGKTLTSKDEHSPWLDSRRNSIDPFYWTRYRELLVRNGWPPLVAATLDRTTNELLDLLGDPGEKLEWKRRGLVMGDVQSGKTASYAALICKAADAGYRMIILLTGTLENVRKQTQERLDAAFVGLDSRDFLSRAAVQNQRKVGAGDIDPRRFGVVFTSRDHDFRKVAASALNISLDAVREPVLVVTKKNKGVLERLASWLRAKNADQDGKIDLPLLLIDDEADNASINTRKNPNETTAINKAIRDLLGLFRRSSYVGFTATPFANIFIDPLSTDDMLGDDLFPRDFIHVLEPPSNYIGMDALFPQLEPDEDPSPLDAFDGIRSVDDGEDWLPLTHQKDTEADSLPKSLLLALRCFLISCAVRDIRFTRRMLHRGGGLHRSMLVNVSRFTAVQNAVADILHLELEEIRRAVRLHGALSPEIATKQSTQIAALAEAFAEEYSDCGLSWGEVLAVLHDAIAPVRVQPVNQGTGAKSLDYSIADAPPGVRVIAVGGNSLSRGLTLEGLSISYFLRNAKAYDTLLQMGRWFGYRDGYTDLCRLWLTEDAEGWYRHVTEATGELKRDFARMRRREATPREFGLRVRTHPDTLIITARNKMAGGLDVVIERDISLIGRGVESARIYSSRARNETNLGYVEKFVSALTSSLGAPIESPHGGAILWRNVPAGQVADFIAEFQVHPLNFGFQPDAISGFVRDAGYRNDPTLARWTIAIPTDGRGGPAHLAALPKTQFAAGRRKIQINNQDQSLLISRKGARVGGRSDVQHGLTKDQLQTAVPAASRLTEDEIRAAMTAPLAVVYLLRGEEPKSPPGQFYRDGLILPALGLHFPGSRDPDAPKNLVRYRLNQVAQIELLPLEIDDDDDVDDAEFDD